MTVYVESNFVLELALEQEQSQSCEALATLAGAGGFRLAIPAYSLAEPNETLHRHGAERKAMTAALQKTLRQIGRSKPHAADATRLSDRVSGLIAQSVADERRRLHQIRRRLVTAADVLPLTDEVLLGAQRTELETSLSPQDALVFVSVLHDLTRQPPAPSLLLTRDKGFDLPDVRVRLTELGCDVIGSYEHGLARVRAAYEL
ncbi:PIN domain-containing protein [Rubrivirga sp.]|uniref:PIN domain-containing protein n=1 Tax=Rubrivirga sp. TaxID=1885344 RepID=UPI003B52F7E7